MMDNRYTMPEIIEAIKDSAAAEHDCNEVHDYVLHGAIVSLLDMYNELLTKYNKLEIELENIEVPL